MVSGPIRFGTVDLEAELDRLRYALHEEIERWCLRVAPTQRRDGCDVRAGRVSLDHRIEFTLHFDSTLPQGHSDVRCPIWAGKYWKQGFTPEFSTPEPAAR